MNMRNIVTARTRAMLATACALMALATASLSAELRYTMRIESQPNTVPPSTPSNPLMTMLGGLVVGTLAPEGGLDINVTMGEQGSRVEYSKAYTVVPAGGVTLIRPDGSMIVIDPAKKTYWRLAKPDLSMLKPDVTVTRTGERSTLVGVAVERATMRIRLPLPVPAGTDLPPGIPTELVVDGETWLTDSYKAYSASAAGLGGVLSLGFEKLAAEGLPIRTILRGEMFGDRQIASSITSIGEVAASAETFSVPEGFSEVDPPSTLPGLN